MKTKLSVTFLITLLFISCSGDKNYIPQSFFELELDRKLIGDEAKEFVDKLHFQDVATMQNEVGFYSGEKGKALIYITYYQTDKEAEIDFVKMTEKISPENSVFIGGEYFEAKGYNVYKCFGMGQTHYVFYHENLLFWLSAETVWAEEFLNEYLEFIK